MWLISGKAGRSSQSGLHCFVLPHYIFIICNAIFYLYQLSYSYWTFSTLYFKGEKTCSESLSKLHSMWQLTCTLILFTIIREFLQMPKSLKYSFYLVFFLCTFLSVRAGGLGVEFRLYLLQTSTQQNHQERAYEERIIIRLQLQDQWCLLQIRILSNLLIVPSASGSFYQCVYQVWGLFFINCLI